MITPDVYPGWGQKIFSVDIVFAKMIKQIEGQVRDCQKKWQKPKKEQFTAPLTL